MLKSDEEGSVSSYTTCNTKQDYNTNRLDNMENEDSSSSAFIKQSYQGQPASYAATALALTVQEWSNLGTGIDKETSCTDDLNILVDRVTSLLLVRIAVVVAVTNGCNNEYFECYDNCDTNCVCSKKTLFTDYSTSTICRTVLMQQKPWHMLIPALTSGVIDQLHKYVRRILSGYNNVPYHNREHAFHVVFSTNKLLDMMLQNSHQQSRNPTFGLRDDPIQLLGLVFAALIHDVEHAGIPNRQLALESDPLAIQFNDISIAEQRSLFIAFTELLKDDYTDLRIAMFGTASVGVDSEIYRRFRMTVVNLVLNTDIASPERTQLAKSKYKEAFGEKVRRSNSINVGNLTSSTSNSISSVNRRNNFANSQHQQGATIPEPQDRQRTTSECSDDYTIPVTPEASEIDSDTDDDIIYQHPTKIAAFKRGQTDDSQIEISSCNNMIHLDKLDYLIRRATQCNSRNVQDDPYEIYRDDDADRRNYHGKRTIRQTEFGGHRIQKSSSLPGKLESSPSLVKVTTLFPIGLRNRRQRRMSAPHICTTFRKRLGIRRSMDLSGEALETYSPKKRFVLHPNLPMESLYPAGNILNDYFDDQPDELKASVVLETIMTAADVAHNLQGWNQMVKWSGRLYMELRRAYVTKRSTADPRNRWYENQIGFLESYLLPLAERLEETGVFGEVGMNFIEIVKNNRDQWLTEGLSVTDSIVADGDARFTWDMNINEIFSRTSNDRNEAYETPLENEIAEISVQSLDFNSSIDVSSIRDMNSSVQLQVPNEADPLQRVLDEASRMTTRRILAYPRSTPEEFKYMNNHHIELIKPRGIRVCLASQWL